MAQLAISVAFATVGFAIGGPTGAQIGFTIGSVVGASLTPNQKQQGPRLSDTKFSGLEYGASVPWYHGTMRMSGIPIYLSDKREVATTTESGGKGGGGVESTTYTYNCDALYLLADVESDALIEVYRQGELIYTARASATDASRSASFSSEAWESIRFYGGASAQNPDPDYEAAQGVGNAPAYIGRTTVFIKRLQLDGGGNLPQLSFVIARDSTPGQADVLLLSNFNGTNGSTTILDESTYALTLTSVNNNHELSTLYSKFGSASLRNKGTNTALSTTFGGSYASTQSLTIEFWVFTPLNPDNSCDFVTLRNDSDTDMVAKIGWVDAVSPDEKAWRLEYGDMTWLTPFALYATANHLGAQWYHVAATFDAATSRARLFVDGRMLLNNVYSGSIFSNAAGRVRIMDTNPPTAGVFYMDGLRITKNVARYTADYNPPTTPPTNDRGIPQTPLDIPLQTVVSDLCLRAGLTTGQRDVSALTGNVAGIISGQIAPVRGILEQLGRCYFFEASEAAALKFVPRAGSSVASIPFADLGAGVGDAAAEPLGIDRGNDIEAPAQVVVSYLNSADGLQSGAEYSDRLVTRSNTVAQQQLAISLTPAQAKGRADSYVIDAAVSRTGLRFSLGLSYAALETGDVVTVADDEGSTYRCRLVKISDAQGVRECEAVLDDAQALSSSGITSSYYAPASTVAAPGDTALYLMDGPLLRDADSVPGHYVAVVGSGRWPGAAALDSLGGTEYAEQVRITETGLGGNAATLLGAWSGGAVWDEINSVRVTVSGALSSYTRDQILNDSTVGAYLIGAHGRWEFINARTATFVSAGVYDLTGLLRGRRGTEHNTSNHAVGDAVVQLRTAGVRSIRQETSDIGVQRYWRGVTLGRPLSTGVEQTITQASVRLKPWAPVDLRRVVNGGGSFTATWQRRSRLSCGFTGTGGIVVPLGEEAESYDVERYNVSNVLQATQTVSAATATFTGATAGDYLRVYQRSAIVGRGYSADITL